MLTFDQIVEKIVAGSGLGRDEILKQIDAEREELRGFVSLEGAASIVALRLGVMIDWGGKKGGM